MVLLFSFSHLFFQQDQDTARFKVTGSGGPGWSASVSQYDSVSDYLSAHLYDKLIWLSKPFAGYIMSMGGVVLYMVVVVIIAMSNFLYNHHIFHRHYRLWLKSSAYIYICYIALSVVFLKYLTRLITMYSLTASGVFPLSTLGRQLRGSRPQFNEDANLIRTAEFVMEAINLWMDKRHDSNSLKND